MVKFTATMHKFGEQGEKTGWTYIEIPVDIATKIKPGQRKEFKVKGKLDDFSIKRISLLPMGGGKFIMPVNAGMRKSIGKKHGAMVKIQLEADDSAFVFNKDFIECLNDEPVATDFFNTLPGSHQRYFSKWIDGAKTEPTRIKRITLAVNALAKKWGYPEMMRNQKNNL
jgi:Domain of unknown function (DUF1905)/Bacteriocin-protection, YdeI or OmpD-Associated